MAQEFTITDDEAHRDRIRSNWTAIGYAYWFTADMNEFWRNDATGHVAEITTY